MNYFIKLIEDNLSKLNIPLLESNGLCNEGKLNEKYFKLFVNYKYLLEKYLNKKLRIFEYDNLIRNSMFKFQNTKDEDKDIYQLSSTMGLDYIYLRNYLFVEKLSSEDIERIISLTNNDLENPSDELFSLIEKTYSTVIDSSFNKETEQMNSYGPDRDRFWHKSSELVFGVRYDMFSLGNMTQDEWLNNYLKQTSFITSTLKNMEEQMARMINKKVNVILYDDYSVEKKKTGSSFNK